MIALWLLACGGDTVDSGDTAPLTETATPYDTVVLSHALDIQPLWTESCVDVGCHEQLEGRVMPLEEGEAWNSLVDRASSQFPLYDLVEPGNPEGSYVIHKLRGTHTDVGGMGRQMPTGKDPLTDDAQALIWAWIKQGAAP